MSYSLSSEFYLASGTNGYINELSFYEVTFVSITNVSGIGLLFGNSNRPRRISAHGITVVLNFRTSTAEVASNAGRSWTIII